MAYNKTTWVNDSIPAINATNLNKIEQGIFDNSEGIDIIIADQPIGTSVIGAITMYGGISAPNAWLECDGTPVSRITEAALFAIVGTYFGIGDGSTTFNLPDMRGQFARGWDNGKDVDVDRVFGSSQDDEFKEHDHTVTGEVYNPFPATNFNLLASNPGTATATTNKSGGTETRPKNIALMFIIKHK